MSKVKNSDGNSARPARTSRDAIVASWEARRDPFVRTPIPNLAPGMFVKSTMNGHGEPYEVLKVDGAEFVACRRIKTKGKSSLKSYVLANDASYFTVCAQSA